MLDNLSKKLLMFQSKELIKIKKIFCSDNFVKLLKLKLTKFQIKKHKENVSSQLKKRSISFFNEFFYQLHCPLLGDYV
jgi:hypothetical protein